MVSETKHNTKIIRSIVTKDSLIEYFKELGINKGMIVYVESAMDYFDNIIGGNRTIIDALKEVVSYDGSIVVRSNTPQHIDSQCSDINYPPYLLDLIRESEAPFNKKKSISKNSLANQLMSYDGVYRSNHPLNSYVAWGKYAKLICDKHPLHFSEGSDSPMNKICELNGFILLLGTKFENCNIFKYARVNDAKTPIIINNSPIEKKGRSSFINMLDYQYQNKDISEIKLMMEERQVVRSLLIGHAKCRLFSAMEAYNLANAYYQTHKEE